MFALFKKNLGAILYRKLLWNEEDDEYMGFEEQGINYEEWKHSKMNKINVHTLNNSQEIE